jgi:hypothetical protein
MRMALLWLARVACDQSLPAVVFALWLAAGILMADGATRSVPDGATCSALFLLHGIQTTSAVCLHLAVFSLMPYDCSGSQLLTHYWAKHFDINIALLDGHIKLPGDVGKGATCLFKLSCSQLPLKSCVYSLIIRAPATITPEQQQLMDAVHGILTSNQGSAVMAAAPAAAGADVRGWLALLRCNHAAAMPGYEVVSYHTGEARRSLCCCVSKCC